MLNPIKDFNIIKINNKNVWIIWKNCNSKCIGYKCSFLSSGSSNIIYKTNEYHEFYETSIIKISEDINNKKNNISNSKLLKNLVFRFNKIKDDYYDVKADNSLLLKLQNITEYVLKPLYYFDNYINSENGILMDKKLTLLEVINKINYNIIKNIKNIKMIRNIKNISEDLNIKLEKYKSKLELSILYIIKKIIIISESLFQYDFRHGDLKINNILCEEHTSFTNIENIKIYITDFGHSGIIIKEEIFDVLAQTSIFQEYILRNKKYDDITFFIIHFYACTSYFFKNNHEIYDEILKNIIIRLYDNKYILDKYQLKTKDPWALYYNNIKFLENNENYNENIKIYNFKYAIKDDYKEIIENRINEIKSYLNIK